MNNPARTADDPGSAADAPGGAIDRRLLELLVCPLTKTTLSYDAERQELYSQAARLAFPIRNGVPMMTVDSARSTED